MPISQIVPTPSGLTSEVLLEFFLVFSRFEYAMKAAGWTRKDRTDAQPDWEHLINAVQDGAGAAQFLLEAGKYLLDAPPKKQIRGTTGELGWSEVHCSEPERQVACLLWSVKRVRNNLFHGGKFELLTNPSERNRRLLEASLRVIEQLLELPVCAEIREKYYAFADEAF